VRALCAARAAAAGSERAVEPDDLARSAFGALDPEARAALEAGGFRPAGAWRSSGSAPAGAALVPGAGLFRRFSMPSKRVLSNACKLAHRLERPNIAPAHVLLAALEASDALARASGLATARARALLAGRDADPSRPDERELPADEELVAILERLGPAADSLSLMQALAAGCSSELRQILARHKVTPALLAGLREEFSDVGQG
jgi:hypothetical protein